MSKKKRGLKRIKQKKAKKIYRYIPPSSLTRRPQPAKAAATPKIETVKPKRVLIGKPAKITVRKTKAEIQKANYDLFYGQPVPWYVINPKLKAATMYKTEDMKKEYTELRKVAMSRLRTLRKSEWGTELWKEYKANGFPAASNLTSREDIVDALIDLKKFLLSVRSTVTGIRLTNKETIEALAERGIIIEAESELKVYGEFINTAKAVLGLKDNMYDIKYVSAVWDTYKQEGQTDPKTLAKYIEQMRKDMQEDGYNIRGKRVTAASVKSAKGLKRSKI